MNEQLLPQEPKPSYTTENWIMLVYVVVIILAIVNPDKALSDLLFPVSLFAGLVAGISFLSRATKRNRGQSGVVQVFSILVGIVGGWVIFCIGAFAGLIGAARHMHGD